ncbi:MAG: hypothetical protein AB7O66_08965 [Limisphaerales bacterium]
MDPIDSPRTGLRLDDTQRELQTLRLTLQITLAALVIFAGSLGILVFRQVSLLRRQTEATTRQAQHAAQVFNSTIGPQAQSFEKRLQEFAETDPEFKARLARFYPPSESATNPPSQSPQPTSAVPAQGNSPTP